MMRSFPLLANKYECTGCMVCFDSCNIQHAIHFELNEEGHWMPVIDKNLCVGCKKCEKFCPVVNSFDYSCEIEPHFYACWNKNLEIRKRSASGGAFSAIAEAVLDMRGVVIGAVINGICDVSHEVIFSKDDLYKLQGSKYTQSNTAGIYDTKAALSRLKSS